MFRLGDHVRRLFDSARINLLEIRFSPRADRGGDPRIAAPQPSARGLRTPDRVPGRRRDGAQPRRQSGAHGRDRVGLGQVSGRGVDGARHPRQDLELLPPPRQRQDDQGQDLRRLRELDPRQARGAARRLRRGADARHAGLCRRGERREHLRGARRRPAHAAAAQRAGRHHARDRDRAGAGRGPALRGAHHHARRALRRRRDLPHGHGGRGDADPRGRPPPDRRRPARAPDPAAADGASSTWSPAGSASTSAGSRFSSRPARSRFALAFVSRS